jgi:hypothetical protein
MKGIKIKTKKLIIVFLALSTIIASIIPSINAEFRENSIEGDIKINIKNDDFSSTPVSVSINVYNYDKNMVERRKIGELSLSEVECLKNELLKTEYQSYSSEDKIEEQFRILHKWDIIPEDIDYEIFLSIANKLGDGNSGNFEKSFYSNAPLVIPGVIVTGPAVWSMFSIGGISYPLHLFLWDVLPPYIMERLPNLPKYFEILSNSSLDGWIGVMPVYVPFSGAAAYVTVLGTVISGPRSFFSPFFAMQVISFGFSIDFSILNDIVPVHVFDWCINAGLLGAIVYIQSK